ncbi:hypothetical protein ACFP67_14105 [Mammaliicoccus sciuri]|uniref:hypothetical protein n=1 Tax=Mammaliicoccus sciuri TaxID=1296 RepID=UPI000CD0B452|nr:hypothetical protein [Mammaliicoccus sciuri]PNZ29999.1 hypothetical protein CD114_01215 [Mammaliicoccus sciuri]
MKAIRTPIEFEVMQFTDENVNKIIEWGKGNIDFYGVNSDLFPRKTLIIKTSDRNKFATYGDYIIKDIYGEFYPVEPNIFHNNYDIIKED